MRPILVCLLVAISPATSFLLVGVGHCVAGERVVLTLAKPEAVQQVAFLNEDKELVSLSESGICLWDRAGGKIVHRWEGTMRSMALSPDGKKLAVIRGTKGERDKVTIWDVKTRKLAEEWECAGEKPEEASGSIIAYSPDGKQLAVSTHHELELWDIARKTIAQRFPLRARRTDVIAAFFPEGREMIVHALPDRWVDRKDISTGKRVGDAAYGGTYRAALSADGDTLAVWQAGAGGAAVGFFNARKGTYRRDNGFRFETGGVNQLSISPDNKLLAVACGEAKVHVLAVEKKAWLARFSIERAKSTSVGFSSDSKALAAGTSDGRIFIWDTTGLIKPEH